MFYYKRFGETASRILEALRLWGGCRSNQRSKYRAGNSTARMKVYYLNSVNLVDAMAGLIAIARKDFALADMVGGADQTVLLHTLDQ